MSAEIRKNRLKKLYGDRKLVDHYQAGIILVEVRRANGVGDPENAGRPRNRDGHLEITGQSVSYKIRREQTFRNEEKEEFPEGDDVFFKGETYAEDGYNNLLERALGNIKITDDMTTKEFQAAMCKKFIDVRTFGVAGAFIGDKKYGKIDTSACKLTRAISIHEGYSVDEVQEYDIALSKSMNDNTTGKPESTRLGAKLYRVRYVLVPIFFSLSVHEGEEHGLTQEDMEKFYQNVLHMYFDDQSNARPSGSMRVRKLIRFDADSKRYNSSLVRESFHIKRKEGISEEDVHDFTDYEYTIDALPGITVTEYDEARI